MPAFGKLRVDMCNVGRLRSYRQTRIAKGASDTTVNRELSYLRAALRRAAKEGFIGALPYFPTTKEDNARQGFLEERDFQVSRFAR